MKLKKNAVPRFFDCQMDRKRAASNSPRRAYKKLKTMSLLNEMLADKENVDSSLQKEEEAMPPITEQPAVIATSSTANEHPPAQRKDIVMHEENAMEFLPCTSRSSIERN